MDDLLGNKFLTVNAFTTRLSRFAGHDDDIYNEIREDVCRLVTDFLQSINVDRRALAIGSEYSLTQWEIYSGNQVGWTDMTYLFSTGLTTMMIDAKKPQRAFVSTPDDGFEFVALLASMGASVSFLNNEWLLFFERFVLPHAEFPDVSYATYDFNELMNLTEPCFDFVSLSATHAVSNNEILDKLIDLMEPGAVMTLSMTNEIMKLYTPEYMIQPVYDVYEILENRDDITYYHMPHGPGYQYVIKS